MNKSKAFRISQEKRLERKLTNKVKELNGLAIKFPAAFVSGFPDRFILMPGGRIYFVEFKDAKKGLQSLQQMWFRQLSKLGFDVRMINTDESLTAFLTELESK